MSTSLEIVESSAPIMNASKELYAKNKRIIYMLCTEPTDELRNQFFQLCKTTLSNLNAGNNGLNLEKIFNHVLRNCYFIYITEKMDQEKKKNKNCYKKNTEGFEFRYNF